MFSKAVICFLLLIFALQPWKVTVAQSHNIEWGTKGSNDKQLYREIIVKEHSFMRVVTEDVPFEGPKSTKITYIKATDQYIDGDGGFATLLSGGVGYKDVKLHLKSQRNHGLNFIIEIYGQTEY